MARTSHHRLLGILRVIALPTLLAGCASLVERAPLVTPERMAAASGRGIDPGVAARGRDLYVGACARCHSPVAVASRTPQQWDGILPRMAAKAQLAPGDLDALRAYVALVSPPAR